MTFICSETEWNILVIETFLNSKGHGLVIRMQVFRLLQFSISLCLREKSQDFFQLLCSLCDWHIQSTPCNLAKTIFPSPSPFSSPFSSGQWKSTRPNSIKLEGTSKWKTNGHEIWRETVHFRASKPFLALSVSYTLSGLNEPAKSGF